jgi:hypothetical protein
LKKQREEEQAAWEELKRKEAEEGIVHLERRDSEIARMSEDLEEHEFEWLHKNPKVIFFVYFRPVSKMLLSATVNNIF